MFFFCLWLGIEVNQWYFDAATTLKCLWVVQSQKGMNKLPLKKILDLPMFTTCPFLWGKKKLGGGRGRVNIGKTIWAIFWQILLYSHYSLANVCTCLNISRQWHVCPCRPLSVFAFPKVGEINSIITPRCPRRHMWDRIGGNEIMINMNSNTELAWYSSHIDLIYTWIYLYYNKY